MEKKQKRLALFGIGIFAVLVLAIVAIYFLTPAPEAPAEKGTIYIPSFASGSNSNPIGNYLSTKPVEEVSIALSKEGFAIDSIVLKEEQGKEFSVSNLVFSNETGELKRIVVVSKKKDGSDYAIDRFLLSPGESFKASIVAGEYLDELISSDDVQVEKTAQGIPLFEISCSLNCEEGSNYFTVYG